MTSFQTYRKMLGYMKPYLPIFLSSIFLSVLVVTLDGMSIWFLGSLPQTLFNPEAIIEIQPKLTIGNLNEYLKYWTYFIINYFGKENPLTMVCGLIVISFTLKNGIFYINRLLTTTLNLSIVRDIRNLFYRHVLMLPVTYYDRNKTGGIVSLVVNDIAQINGSMTGTLSKLVMEPLRIFFFVSMLLIINVKLTVTVFVIYPILGYIIIKIGKVVKRRAKRTLENYSGLVSVLSETIQGVRVVKMFNMNDVECKKFDIENEKYIKSSFRAAKARAIVSPLTETLAMYVTALLLWHGGNGALSDASSFSAEDFFRFLFYLFLAYQPWKSLGNVYSTIQSGIAAAERVFDLLDTPAEDLDGDFEKNEYVLKKDIRAENVSFVYPECKEEVLKDINFVNKKGEVIAIVGSSGSGKTTILDLLPRFYDITSGKISIDGKDIRDFNLKELRDFFGIVSQDTILFNDTVYNNISYGSQKASKEEVQNAADAANATEFINKLPKGMDTVIGERGVTLSGGQRQRLSIARALLRNPQILILDEATSALDTESEKLVQHAINNLIKNRTVFVVAHRLSTIQNADTIIVLEDGKIIEQGGHEELLALNKRYKYFYDIQFGK